MDKPDSELQDQCCEKGVPSTTDRILNAAFKLFIEQGIRATTTREIAAVAEVNEVTLFRHFGNKDGLLDQVIAREAPIPAMPPELFDSLCGSPAKDIRFIAEQMYQIIAARRDWVNLVMRNAHQYPRLAQHINTMRTPVFEAFKRYIQRQIDAGALQPVKPAVAATMLIGPIISLFTLFESGPTELIPADVSSAEVLEFHICSYLAYVLPANTTPSTQKDGLDKDQKKIRNTRKKIRNQ